MIFIASASGGGPSTRLSDSLASTLSVTNSHPQAPNVLSAVISEEVCWFAFLDLFCSQSISYELLGEGAYTSFQFLFKKLRQSPETMHRLGGPALDALWRICLKVQNDAVAAQAMKDLLAVYVSMPAGNHNSNGWLGSNAGAERMDTDDEDEKFEKRVFDYLVAVRQGLEAGEAAAERSAERCLRILNAAIGQNGSAGRLIPSSTIKRLTCLPTDIALADALKCLPHGMRGQASYRRIGILAKRTAVHNQQISQGYNGREDASSASSQTRSSTHRFSMDVHPLETLASIKSKVANCCECPLAAVKPVSVSGRVTSANNRSSTNDPSNVPLNVVSEDCIVDELGIMQGCEMVFVISDRPMGNASPPKTSRTATSMDLSDIFFSTEEAFSDRLFQMLLAVLDALPWPQSLMETDSSTHVIETHKLVWDLMQAMPTNSTVSSQVQVAADATIGGLSGRIDSADMAVDAPKLWPTLLELRTFHSSVYVLQVIDHFLQPATPEIWSILPSGLKIVLENELQAHAVTFRQGFIESGGFDAVVRFFSSSDGDEGMKQSKTRMGNAVALRILKCCLFGSRISRSPESATGGALDGTGTQLLQSLADAEGLLMSLTAMVITDSGISTSTISDVLKFLRLLFRSPQTARSFVSLQSSLAEKFLITLLLWEGGSEAARTGSNASAASKVRKSAHDLILATPILADHALQWLIQAIDSIDVASDSTSEYFDVLQKLVAADRGATAQSRKASENELKELGTGVCRKLASCPRPTSETSIFDFSTGVLCCCLALLRALTENGGGGVLLDGTTELVQALGVKRWSEMISDSKRTVIDAASSFSLSKVEDITLVDLMGAVFDGFLCPGGSTSVVAICCDKESRQRGFDVVGAAARSCGSSDGYSALVARISEIVKSSSPFLRHRWGQNGSTSDGNSRSLRNPSKYSGLRNQGCTCYMNSVLQQLFMMHELRKVICHAPIPTCLRSSGGGVVSAKGAELVGKKLALQWESGVSYDAVVEAFDQNTGMHTIRYCRMQVATVGGGGHQQVHPDDIADLPPDLPDEFLLSEGRPGKETGVFEIVADEQAQNGPEQQTNSSPTEGIEETDDEATSRHLLEEVQRTFIHLDEGSRGRCFDPRALVEACGCLKLEFDVWQQNDASEFATKLLDRLEISLKRWAPSHCRYLDHTFGLKQTKQKICKECGLKVR
jgi:ubiquitin carboxyl-terminal hydrolase 9/24